MLALTRVTILRLIAYLSMELSNAGTAEIPARAAVVSGVGPVTQEA